MTTSYSDLLIRLNQKRFHLSDKIKFLLIEKLQEKKIIKTEKKYISSPEMLDFQSIEHGELQIRKLVEWGSSWDILKNFCFKLFEISKNQKHVAHSFELCFLHGTENDLIQLLKIYKDHLYESFLLIQSHVRGHILLHIKKKQDLKTTFKELIALSCFRKDFFDTDILELFIIFEYLTEEKDFYRESFYLFEKNEIPWNQMIHTMGSSLGYSLDDLYLIAAKSAYQEGLLEKSLNLAKKISKDSFHHSMAIDIGEKILKHEKMLYQDHLIHKIKLSKNPKEQYSIIKTYLVNIHNHPDSFDLVVMNQWLNQPFSCMHHDGYLWRQFADLLIMFYNQNTSIKNILKPFRKSLEALAPLPLLQAFWSFDKNLLNQNDQKIYEPFQSFFRFLADPHHQEDDLWNCFFQFESTSPFEIPWSVLRDRFLDGFKNRRWKMSEEDRHVLYTKLSVATHQPSIQDISEYIKISSCKSEKPLDFLYEKIKNKDYQSLSTLIFLKKGQMNYFKNDDLKVLSKSKDRYIAWSAIHILKARQALPFYQEETKTYLLTQTVRSIDSHLCCYDFPQEYKKMVLSFIHIGPMMPFFLSHYTDGIEFPSFSKTLIHRGRSNLEFLFEKILKESDIFENSCGFYTIKKNQQTLTYEHILPIFCKKMKKEEPWFEALTFMYHVLGISSWEGQLIQLKKIASESYYYDLYKFEKSLAKKLTTRQKSGLKDFMAFAKSIKDEDIEEAQLYLWTFICRITLLFFSYPIDAIESLQKSQSHYFIIRKMENFILSKHFEMFQKSKKDHIRDVPQTITAYID